MVFVLATNAAKAPASIMPSMPMLMIPVRSQRMPHMAPRMSGTLARSVKLSALMPKKTRIHVLSPNEVVLTRIAMTMKTRISPPIM